MQTAAAVLNVRDVLRMYINQRTYAPCSNVRSIATAAQACKNFVNSSVSHTLVRALRALRDKSPWGGEESRKTRSGWLRKARLG